MYFRNSQLGPSSLLVVLLLVIFLFGFLSVFLLVVVLDFLLFLSFFVVILHVVPPPHEAGSSLRYPASPRCAARDIGNICWADQADSPGRGG